MTKRKDGGPAFPMPPYSAMNSFGHTPIPVAPADGMTLRDYFAAKALQSLIFAATNDATRTMERFNGGGEIPRGDFELLPE